METALEKVLRLATYDVRPFERLERGREQAVRGHTATRAGEATGYIPPAKWAQGQKTWEQRGEAAAQADRTSDARAQALRARGFSENDIKAMEGMSAKKGAAMRRELPARPGTPGHAAELRSLAREHGQRIAALQSMHPGQSGAEDFRRMGGRPPGRVPESDIAATLNRAAELVEKGQPSLARLHAQAISDEAKRWRDSAPDYANRLDRAASKLRGLPAGQGAAALPAKETAEESRRTRAAEDYAHRAGFTGVVVI